MRAGMSGGGRQAAVVALPSPTTLLLSQVLLLLFFGCQTAASGGGDDLLARDKFTVDLSPRQQQSLSSSGSSSSGSGSGSECESESESESRGEGEGDSIWAASASGQLDNNESNQSRERRSRLAPATAMAAAPSQNGSPLASAWKAGSQLQPLPFPGTVVKPMPGASAALIGRQQQQSQAGGSAGNDTSTNQQSSVRNSNSNSLLRALDLSSINVAALVATTAFSASNSRELGSINESLTTDFPNPNINNAGHEITNILKKFFLHGYDKRVRPNYSGPPALVNVSFHIIGISSVSEVQMDFTTDFYFRQKWFDPRLEFKPVGQIDELCVGAEFAEKIWLPDTFFANEKTATFHKATTENTFIRVGHNGRVYRSIRLTVTCSCPMDLQYFPMDRQRCKIEIESYGYNTRDIDYRWEKGNESVSLDGKIELPQFKVLGFKMGHELQSLSSGDYIRLYCEIHFVRSMGYYLIQIYIPASLIVIISWVSFWLHRNATPARVALGVTTVLTMTTLMSSTNAALPKISYIKSIDVFLGTCFVMVFASLLEYASVGYIGKRIAMKRKRQQELKQMQQHHQKVCVAAAASAAAAAVAAQQTNPAGVAPAFVKQQLFVSDQQFESSCRQRRTNQSNSEKVYAPMPTATTAANAGQQQQSILVRRLKAAALAQAPMTTTATAIATAAAAATTTATAMAANALQAPGDSPPGYPAAGQRSTIKIMPEQQQQRQPHYLSGSADLTNKPTQQPQSAPATSGQPQAEFETAASGKQASGEDMVRICGLTPSAIDKYSRVVFPICFVCFNLMYWIIYGHISQQIDDKGPPLIPFVRS